MLPILERALLEVSGRCQDVAAMENLLMTLKPHIDPLLIHTRTTGTQVGNDIGESHARLAADTSDNNSSQGNLLQPFLQALDTSSLPSYYWRSLASSLPSVVQEILSRGGVSARALRSNRERLRSDFRGCVLRGSQIPTGITKGAGHTSDAPLMGGNWEREAAVMVGSVVGVLGKSS
jgi:hypothetical protein